MEAAKDASLHNGASAQSAPRLGPMMEAEAAIDVTVPYGQAGQVELPKAGPTPGVTLGSETCAFSPVVRDNADRQAEDKTETTSKPAHHNAREKRSHRRHRRKNKTEDYDDPVNPAPLKRQSKTKAGHHKSQDGLATNKSRDHIRKPSHRNPTNKEGMGNPEDAANVTGGLLNGQGGMEAPLDHIAMEAATASGTTEKGSKKKKRKKHHKTAAWAHQSETANRDDSKNWPKVVDKFMPGGSSSLDPGAQKKSSDSAVIKETQLGIALQAGRAHQAAPAEATSVDPVVTQADKADVSDDRQQQFKDLKEAEVVASKLKRPLPTTGGPFGALWSTRSSSPEHSGSHSHRTAEACAIDVKQQPPSLSPKQTCLSTIENGREAHAELRDRPGAFSPPTQESERNVKVLDHTGPFPEIAETEREHSDTNRGSPLCYTSAGAKSTLSPHQQQSTSMHHGAGTGRRVSIALPTWGGPFGLLSSSPEHSSESVPDTLTAQRDEAKHKPSYEPPLCVAPSSSAAWGGPFGLPTSSREHSNESLTDKWTAQIAEAKHEPPQESPLYMAPSSEAAFKKEEEMPLPRPGALAPSKVTKKVARHVLEETAFTVSSDESEEDACVQHKKPSPTSTCSLESSELKSSEGSFALSSHAKPEKDVKVPRRVRSMSLVLLEDAPLLLSQPVVTPTSPLPPPPPPPPEAVPPMPKLERPDLFQQAPIPPTGAAESGKREKTAAKGKKERFKKTKKKEVTNAVSSPSTDGPDPDKPTPKSSEAQVASASRVCSVNEINKRIEVLRCQQVDFTASSGAHSPLRTVEFKHDHAVLTDKGEVKLCLDVSTCEEATMLWPFDLEAANTKKDDA